MKSIDRILLATLGAGFWLLAGLQIVQFTAANAQEQKPVVVSEEQRRTQQAGQQLNATEIVGLEAQIERILRERQLSPRSIAGLDQHIRSIVRRCRVSGGTTGNRISNASITC